MRLSILLVTALLSAGSVAAHAHPHTVSLAQRAGDVNSTFVFAGRGWQPRKRVVALYYVSAGAKRPYREFHFKPGSKGGFVFRFTKPIGLVDSGVTSRMCFRQRDTTRRRHPHVYRACADFYVAAPAAQFMPSTGRPGNLFLLVASGFLAGHRLTGTLTLPTGETSTFHVRTRNSDAFVSGGPFGPIFVRRGGATVRFPSKPDDPPGLYSVLFTDDKAGSRARAVLELAQ